MADVARPSAPKVTWVIEVSDEPPSTRDESSWRALYSACITLGMGVLGSTILPVPFAFSQTGVAVGCLTMALVAFCNARTCSMMIRAAAHTGLDTYEELAEWAAGPRFKVLTQVSLIVLLYGTMCGGMAFLADIDRIMVEQGFGDKAPALLRQDGRPVLVAITLIVLLPLCLQRHIRQVESAATLGFGVVVALCSIIVAKAIRAGFPAMYDGELPLLSLRVDGKVFEAFAVLGFAFYIQPMLMPLRKEMPAGHIGTVLTERATHITLYGVACLTYGVVGIFGASIYGQHTEGNIMVNNLVDGRWQSLTLYIALMLYLCVGMVTTHYALRSSVDILLFGANQPFTWPRQVLLTSGTLGASLTVALLFPTAAEKIFALTGCSAVCIVCYVVPCVIDVKLLHHLDQHDHSLAVHLEPQGLTNDDGMKEPLLQNMDGGVLPSARAAPVHTRCYVRPHMHKGPDSETCRQNGHSSAPPWGTLWGRLGVLHQELLAPCLLVAVGVGFSIAGLYVAVSDALKAWAP